MSWQRCRLGVCSWSLQPRSIPELQNLLAAVGANWVQVACGDPQHASWAEGDEMPAAARAAGLHMTGAMIGFPGEDYSTPQTIAATGGFADPRLRSERLEILHWALRRTRALELNSLSFHAGFIPKARSDEYRRFVDTLAQAARIAQEHSVTLALETGQETTAELLQCLRDLQTPWVRLNFDPANMLLYDRDDPLVAIEALFPYVHSVHLKDAHRPQVKGTWGEEVPLGTGSIRLPEFLATLGRLGFAGPLMVEREVGTQPERVRDIRLALERVRALVPELQE
jgi:sugar phosphate isomerase/epimerase